MLKVMSLDYLKRLLIIVLSISGPRRDDVCEGLIKGPAIYHSRRLIRQLKSKGCIQAVLDAELE